MGAWINMKESKKPLIVVNFKTYPEATGANAVKLSKEIENMALEYRFEVILIPQPTDIYRISQEVELPLYGQHADDVKPIRNTGKITLESLKSAGVKGILINHSEDSVNLETIESLILKSKLMKLKTIVCAQDINQVKAISAFKPDYIAFEPPELISGDKSIASLNKNIIGETAKTINYLSPGVKLLIGAGIKTRKDLETVIEQKADGVFVSSGIVKSKNPGIILMEWMQDWF